MVKVGPSNTPSAGDDWVTLIVKMEHPFAKNLSISKLVRHPFWRETADRPRRPAHPVDEPTVIA